MYQLKRLHWCIGLLLWLSLYKINMNYSFFHHHDMFKTKSNISNNDCNCSFHYSKDCLSAPSNFNIPIILSLSYLLATAMCILYNVSEYSIDVAQFCKVITTYQSKTYHNFWRIYFWQIEEHLLVVLLNAHNTYTQDGLYWLVYFKLEYLSSP